MSDWNVIAGHFLTRDEVVRLTGLPPIEVARHPALLRLECRVSEVETYPAFQFDRDGRPVVGIEVVLAGLASLLSPIEVAGFLSMPAPGLGGRAPINWLRDGGSTERVFGLVA